MLNIRRVDPRKTTSESTSTRFEVHIRNGVNREEEFEITSSRPNGDVSVLDALSWVEEEYGSDADFDLYLVLAGNTNDDSRPLIKLH